MLVGVWVAAPCHPIHSDSLTHSLTHSLSLAKASDWPICGHVVSELQHHPGSATSPPNQLSISAHQYRLVVLTCLNQVKNRCSILCILVVFGTDQVEAETKQHTHKTSSQHSPIHHSLRNDFQHPWHHHVFLLVSLLVSSMISIINFSLSLSTSSTSLYIHSILYIFFF